MLYSLAIVDDERAIRRGLTTHVDWESMGFQVVAAFEDGEDALEYLSSHHLDVVLTDIRMSVVSGLTLAQTIHDQGIPTEVVLLSGYREFEYARTAMQAGVYDYLLKPTQRDEIEGVFSTLRRKLAERYASASDATVQRLLRNSRRKLLTRVTDGAYESEASLHRAWRQSGLRPIRETTRIRYALLRVQHRSQNSDSARDSGARKDDIGTTDDELMSRIEAFFARGAATTAIAAAKPEGLLHLLVTGDEEEESDDASKAPSTLSDRIAEGLRSARSELDTDPQPRTWSVETVLHDAAVEGSAGLLSLHRRIQRAVGEDVEGGIWSAVQSETMPVTPTHSSRRGSRTIEDALRFIEVHLSEDLGLERVARELFVSPGYFCRLFKQETGKTFLEYLTHRRIDAGAGLLDEPNGLSIREVAHRVGYRDPKYFARLFKAQLGQTPSQFKRRPRHFAHGG